MPEGSVWLTKKVKEDLDKIANDNGVTREAVANVILRWAFSDEQEVKKVVSFIKSTSAGGQWKLTEMGW